MLFTNVYRNLTIPVVSLTLSAFIIAADAFPCMAQRSTRQRATPRPNANSVQAEDAYTLGVGDKIRIDNVDLPQQSGEYVVPTGGLLNLPLIGSVSVLGLTIEQVDRVLTERYNSILKQPDISVKLVEPRPLNIVVSGEVSKPGSYTIPVFGREPGIRYPTVSQLIQQAEGVTQTADISRIQVRRPQRSGSQQTINVNLRQFLQTGRGGQDITLRDGDTIFVPTATNVTLSQARELATTSIATDLNKPRTVTVLGEVSRPGPYVVLGGETLVERTTAGLPTVTRAIQLAGGITLTADIRNVQVRRRNKAGREQVFRVNLWQFLQAGDSTQNLILQDGDTVFIPTGRTFTDAEVNQLINASITADITRPRTVTVLGEITRPGAYVVVGGNTTTDRTAVGRPTVTRAIQLAGGVSPTSDIRNVQLRRITRSGEQIISINLWEFLQTGDSSQDLLVQDGDTIFIPTATTFNAAEARRLANASFAVDIAKPRTVAVAGEVNRPGTYVVVGGDTKSDSRTLGGFPTVARAIQLAGGITTEADIRNIQLRRPTLTGTDQIININLWKLLQAGDFTQDIIVQEGDSIFIPTARDVNPAEVAQLAGASFSPATIQVSVVGEVGRPGQLQVAPDTTLNQALLAAGGFNRSRSRRSTVQLIRLNPNGTVTQRTVAVDFRQAMNEQANPLLQNNDIIVVGRSILATVGDTLDAAFGPGGLFSVFRILEILGILR